MQTQTLMSIIPAILASMTTYYVAHRNIFSPIKIETANKQLYNIYLPLFTFLEPHLYKKIDTNVLLEFINLFNKLKQEHYELINSDLLTAVFLLEKSTTTEKYNYYDYEYLCKTLDILFERTRKKLYLPTRKFTYKVTANQLNNSTNEFINIVSNSILEIAPAFLVGLIFYIVWIIFTTIISFITK